MHFVFAKTIPATRRRDPVIRVASVIAALVFIALSAADVKAGDQQAILTGRAVVVDGDTLEIQGRRIRLHGVDAPESDQTCMTANKGAWRAGQASALALANHLGAAPVLCRPTGAQSYNRIIAVCSQRARTLVNGWSPTAWLGPTRNILATMLMPKRRRRARVTVCGRRNALPPGIGVPLADESSDSLPAPQ